MSALCDNFDEGMKITGPEPPLPVTEGSHVTFKCQRKHSLIGGSLIGTCQGNQIIFQNEDPNCSKISKFSLYLERDYNS